jgi:hypothetical protein
LSDGRTCGTAGWGSRGAAVLDAELAEAAVIAGGEIAV